jgi:UDP-N-acetyl-D-galactosamine dehydrogenase
MNELSIIFNRMGINTFDVLEAAGTKWNFLKFYPGLVGGHCIGVDPYYLSYKAKKLRYHTQIINSGRFVNDSMGFYVAKQTVKKIIAAGKPVHNARVLIMGATFKEDVADIRNSKVIDVYRELLSYGADVDIVDPHANTEELSKEYGIQLAEKPGNNYDAIIVAVSHQEYKDLDEAYFSSLLAAKGILVDVKGIYRHNIQHIEYWSL